MMKCKVYIVLVAALSLSFSTLSVAQTTWRVDDDLADYPAADFTHPQDAVNAASPGDTILVYPGVYTERTFSGGVHDTPDYTSSFITVTYATAPALIVYKDNLTIRAVDRRPSRTIIQSTHEKYCEPVAIQASTGGTWDGAAYVGAGVNPTELTAFHAVCIIASGVRLEGFTIRASSYSVDWSASVIIGALDVYFDQDYSDDPFVGNSNLNTIRRCVFDESTQHIAILIVHSSGNLITRNTIDNSASHNESALEIFDGFNTTTVAVAPGSRFNVLSLNRITGNGTITVGARLFGEAPTDPALWTNNNGTLVLANRCKAVDTQYSKFLKTYLANDTDRAGVVLNSSGILVIGEH